MNEERLFSMLSNITVLDLTDEKGAFCSRLLADMGALVIKIENPGGGPDRNQGPYFHNEVHPEKSLSWFALNLNKKGITLNIKTSDGKKLFKQLARKANVLVESYAPGFLDSLGLGYLKLKEISPSIIMTSITAYGQSGPYSGYKASDLTAMAMSGVMYMTGDPDHPPVRIGSPQAYYHAGLHGAIGTMLALLHQKKYSEGQHIDVSVQQSILLSNMNALRYWEFNKINIKRAGEFIFRPFSGVMQRQTWPCKDGYVCFSIIGGTIGTRRMTLLVEWMDSEGMAPEFLKTKDWTTLDFTTMEQEELDRLSAPIADFFKSKTKQVLSEGAAKRGISLFPQSKPKELLDSKQLMHRNYWQNTYHPELDAEITYPGPWMKPSKTPLSIRHRPPLIGEHNHDIYVNMLGLSENDLAILKYMHVI
jgi:crotonobetainyl-CoA:carnitine CoA-transferase CaiB-like acyl-CoA transferase